MHIWTELGLGAVVLLVIGLVSAGLLAKRADEHRYSSVPGAARRPSHH